jgi:hypothetical protein
MIKKEKRKKIHPSAFCFVPLSLAMTKITTLQNLPSKASMYLGVLPTILKKGSNTFPSIQLELPSAKLDGSKVDEYHKICGFPANSPVPSTYLHAFIFPLQSLILSDPSFPFPMLGLIHFANSIKQYRPLLISESFSVKCWLGKQFSHEKGQAFEILCEIRVGQELVWEESSVILHRGKIGVGNPLEWPQPTLSPKAKKESWSMPANLGRKFAKVSGDYNPIHLYPFTAKLFGFPRNIAHGMWSLGKALAKYPKATEVPYELTVLFKTPVLLPAQVVFREQEGGLGIEFDLVDKNEEKPHMRAYLRALNE